MQDAPGEANLFTVTQDARIVKAPDGREFVVEMWKPSLGHAWGLWDGLLLTCWSVVKPGWRVNVKNFPVKGPKAVHRERIRSKADAERRIDEIAESLQRGGWPPPAPRPTDTPATW